MTTAVILAGVYVPPGHGGKIHMAPEGDREKKSQTMSVLLLLWGLTRESADEFHSQGKS